MAGHENSKTHVFVCYSHKDRRWLERLKVHLKPLTREYDLEVWEDTRLTPSSKWREEIRTALDKADAAILIVSPDFLASDFINTNELPPLLKSSAEEGALIVPVIANYCLFLQQPELSQFHAINEPSHPLVALSEGEQEKTFQRISVWLFEKIGHKRTETSKIEPEQEIRSEDFLSHDTWTRLISIGDWIFDEDLSRIIGSGTHAYLFSRDQFGDRPFVINTTLEFSNFSHPKDGKLGMNAGVIWGIKSETGGGYRYYNLLITGHEILIERIGFEGGTEGKDFQHITKSVPFMVNHGKSYNFEIYIDNDYVRVKIDDQPKLRMTRPKGIIGRVGLRPWRSRMDCTKFVVEEQPTTGDF